MKKFLPLISFLIIVLFFFKPFFLNNFLPIPSDTIVGLYHPYRDFFAKDYPRGIPFKNFLITDPVRQEYPWRYLSILLEKKFALPLWNPYNFAGTPLLANFQSAPFYPLNILFFIFPFNVGWSLLIFLEPLLAGIFMYLYLRNLKINSLSSFLGGFVFAFCGFSTSWLEWNTIVHVALWVPLILLAKDKLINKWSLGWALVFFFSEVSAVLAGHIQVLFYAFCLTNIYLFVRVFQKSQKINKGKNFVFTYAKIYLPFLLVGFLIYLLTSVQWAPAIQFIKLSTRDLDQANWMASGWFIPWQNLIQFVAPDFFGNPATLNYWGVWNYAEFVGYVGIIPLLFALFAMFFRRDKKTFFFGTLFFLSLIFSLPTPLAKIPYILHIPFISTSQPTRLLFISDLCLAVLCALGLDFFMKTKNKGFLVIASIFGFIFLSLWVFIFRGHTLIPSLSIDKLLVMKRNLILTTGIFLVSSVVVILIILFSNKTRYSSIFYLLLAAITIFDLLHFSQKFTPFVRQNYLFPNTKAIDFLQKNIGNYRYMTTSSEIFPPNFSIVYRLQTVDGYDPLFLKNYAELIAASERGNPDISAPFGFNRIITPHAYNSKFVDLLGVKYILSLTDIKTNHFKKVFLEGETRIYENLNVIPRAFFVKNVLTANNSKNSILLMFDSSVNLRNTAIVEGNFEKRDFGIGETKILQYSENKVILESSNDKEGFLVLSDSFYPSWSVFVDGKKQNIYQTDYNFRGIYLSRGEHTIIFTDNLF